MFSTKKDQTATPSWVNHPRRLEVPQRVARARARVEEIQSRITAARRLCDHMVDGPVQIDLAEAWKARRELPQLRDQEMAAFGDLIAAEREHAALDEDLRAELMPALRESLKEPLANLYVALRRVAEEENAALAEAVAKAEAAIGRPGAFGQLVWNELGSHPESLLNFRRDYLRRDGWRLP
jgi:division protein CdvB (Snf7/Vps24/ESCRT-III family)